VTRVTPSNSHTVTSRESHCHCNKQPTSCHTNQPASPSATAFTHMRVIRHSDCPTVVIIRSQCHHVTYGHNIKQSPVIFAVYTVALTWPRSYCDIFILADWLQKPSRIHLQFDIYRQVCDHLCIKSYLATAHTLEWVKLPHSVILFWRPPAGDWVIAPTHRWLRDSICPQMTEWHYPKVTE